MIHVSWPPPPALEEIYHGNTGHFPRFRLTFKNVIRIITNFTSALQNTAGFNRFIENNRALQNSMMNAEWSLILPDRYSGDGRERASRHRQGATALLLYFTVF